VENSTDFTRATIADGPAGAIVVTPRTIWFGFGLEGVAASEDRTAIMDRVLKHFGVAPPPPPSWDVYLPVLRRGS
jgi:hypothetical protein